MFKKIEIMFQTLAIILGSIVLLNILVNLILMIYEYFIRPKFANEFEIGKWSSTNQPWAIVTGGGSGVGRGFCEELAKKGFKCED